MVANSVDEGVLMLMEILDMHPRKALLLFWDNFFYLPLHYDVAFQRSTGVIQCYLTAYLACTK